MFRLVEGTNIVGEDVICPTGALKNVPAYEYSDAFGEVPLTLENSVAAPFNGMHVYGRSEQFTTTGAQLLNPALYTDINPASGLIYEFKPDSSIIISGKIIDTSTLYLGNYIDLLENGKTYYSAELNATNSAIKVIYNDGTPTDYIRKVVVDKSRMTSIIPYIQYTVSKPPIESHIYPMFSEGNTAKPWEPYTGGRPSPNLEYPQEIVNAGEKGNIEVEVRGKNLFKNSQHSAGFYSGNVGNTINTVMNAGYSWEADLSVLPGTELTLSVISPILSKFRFFVIDNNRIILLKHEDYSANSIDYTNTFTMPENGSRLCVSVISVSAPEGVTIMLNKGKAALPYEPYVEPQYLTLATPNGLPGIPVTRDGNYTDSKGQQYICDEIDLGRGKYVGRTWKNVYDGSENWIAYRIETTQGFYIVDALPFSANRRGGLSNYATSYDRKFDYPVERLWIGALNRNLFVVNNRMYNQELEDNGLANWKALLAKHPMTLITYLDNPIERDLTPEELAAYSKLTANDGTTVIDIEDENIPTYVSATYPVIPAYGKMEGNTLRVSKVQSEGFKPIITDSITYAEVHDSVFIGYMDRPDSIAKVYGVDPLDERTE